MRTVENFKIWALNKKDEYMDFARTSGRFQILYYKNNTLLVDKKLVAHGKQSVIKMMNLIVV